MNKCIKCGRDRGKRYKYCERCATAINRERTRLTNWKRSVGIEPKHHRNHEGHTRGLNLHGDHLHAECMTGLIKWNDRLKGIGI